MSTVRYDWSFWTNITRSVWTWSGRKLETIHAIRVFLPCLSFLIACAMLLINEAEIRWIQLTDCLLSIFELKTKSNSIESSSKPNFPSLVRQTKAYMHLKNVSPNPSLGFSQKSRWKAFGSIPTNFFFTSVNRITLGQTKNDSINWMIPITE
jgi:hypothetical protein